VQFYHYFVSQSSEFCRHNPLCCFSTSNTKGKRIFRYRLSPETFRYTFVELRNFPRFIQPEYWLPPTKEPPTGTWSRISAPLMELPKFLYSVHKNLPLDPVLGQINSIHILVPFTLNMEAAWTSERVISCPTWSHNPEDHDSHTTVIFTLLLPSPLRSGLPRDKLNLV